VLAASFGWSNVFGFALIPLILTLVLFAWLAKNAPQRPKAKAMADYFKALGDRDSWWFMFFYSVTFGGFIGLASVLPSYYFEQFGVSKVQAGQLATLAALTGAALRVAGGGIADRWGGVNTLSVVLAVVAASLVLIGLSGGSLLATTLLMMLCFAALGAGNGALFQLVPLRWPAATAVAGSMIGELGALGGGLVPGSMGVARQYAGSYGWGFLLLAALALLALGVLRRVQARWTGTWAGRGGRARADSAANPFPSPAGVKPGRR
jgi:NNP family nitrate/nitrite transporter-like MFS transporter